MPAALVTGATTLRPVMRELAKAGFELVVATDAAMEAMKREKLPVEPLGKWFNDKIAVAAANDAAVLTSRVVEALNEGLPQAAVAEALGKSPLAMRVAGGLPNWLAGFAMQQLADATTTSLVMENLLREKEIAIFVTHEDITDRFRQMTRICQAHGIPTLHVPHGNYGGHSLERSPDSFLVADVAAVAGAYQQEFFAKRGASLERLPITGNPAWDEHYRVAKEGVQADAKRALGFQLEKPVAAVVTTWALGMSRLKGEWIDKSWRLALTMMKLLPRVQWLVSVHPNSPPGSEQRLGETIQREGIGAAITRGHYWQRLLAPDVHFVFSQTNFVAAAAILGRPAVGLEYEEYAGERRPCWDGDGAVLKVPPEPAAMADAVRRALTPEYQERWRGELLGPFLRRYNGPSDGHAAERVVALAAKMMEGGGDG